MIERKGGEAGGCVGTLHLSDDLTQWTGYHVAVAPGVQLDLEHGETVLSHVETATVVFETPILMVEETVEHREFTGTPGEEEPYDPADWDVVETGAFYRTPYPINVKVSKV